MKNILLIILIPVFMFADYNYSSQDYNETSPTYREDVWSPSYPNHITLHYFSTQG